MKTSHLTGKRRGRPALVDGVRVKLYHFTLHPEHHERLDALAVELGVKGRSAVVRLLIDQAWVELAKRKADA